jgi:hypothetical protein
MSIAMILPPETLELVFSYLIEEATCLRSCSLVSRAWRDVAQSTLCRHSTLYLRRLLWSDPNQMRDMSAIIPLFRHMIISCFSFTDTPDTCQREGARDGDDHLMFESTYISEPEAPKNVAVRWDRAVAVVSNITLLHLSHSKFKNFAALRDVLAGFPALERLSLHGVNTHHTDDLPTWTGLRLRRLRSDLRIDEATIRALLTWLATTENPRLEELRLRYSEPSEPVCNALRGVLLTCVRSLRMLEVDHRHREWMCRGVKSFQHYFQTLVLDSRSGCPPPH